MIHALAKGMGISYLAGCQESISITGFCLLLLHLEIIPGFRITLRICTLIWGGDACWRLHNGITLQTLLLNLFKCGYALSTKQHDLNTSWLTKRGHFFMVHIVNWRKKTTKNTPISHIKMLKIQTVYKGCLTATLSSVGHFK